MHMSKSYDLGLKEGLQLSRQLALMTYDELEAAGIPQNWWDEDYSTLKYKYDSWKEKNKHTDTDLERTLRWLEKMFVDYTVTEWEDCKKNEMSTICINKTNILSYGYDVGMTFGCGKFIGFEVNE